MSTTTPGERSRVDTTMMYAVHDAFQRDLERLTAMARSGAASGEALQVGWARFQKFLHIHHTAEDTHLWPVLRDKAADTDVLDRMEAEHAELTALLDAVDTAVSSGASADHLLRHAERLTDALAAHCEHEEEFALPLAGALLTVREWDAFGGEQRRRLGPSGAATFFPWLLDGADDSVRRKVLGHVPPPVRLIYRAVWRPRYLRAPRWQAPAA
ncbi:hemerythrin domain-containing protein [Actinomadura roseirufa]|uniref:hemerythrin domain-containing protein n=1 Tax=Actinomadura roseirufa TaxID=2094049 RepID=UPI001041114E|nr:hemerythrin domain-containing protein [Actinomadura roseirufa]